MSDRSPEESIAKYKELERWKDRRDGYDEGFVAGWRAGLVMACSWMEALSETFPVPEGMPPDACQEIANSWIASLDAIKHNLPQLESLFDTQAPAWYEETAPPPVEDPAQPHVQIPEPEKPENSPAEP